MEYQKINWIEINDQSGGDIILRAILDLRLQC